MTPGYTIPAVLAVAAVCAWELAVLRTGLFRRRAYWITTVIVLGFQIPVDGWLTKLSAPIVRYAPRHISGLRAPWDIPVEDFLFGFALVTAVLLRWERQAAGDRHPAADPATDGDARADPAADENARTDPAADENVRADSTAVRPAMNEDAPAGRSSPGRAS